MIAPRLLGLALGHGDADRSPSGVDRHRQDRLRVAGAAEAVDAVAVEQRHDDAGLDVGRRCEKTTTGRIMDRERRRQARTAAAPTSCIQQHHRHIVLLRRRSGKRLRSRAGSRSRRSRRMADRACSLEQAGQPRVAEAVAVRVHRLADAVGVEDEEIAAAERHASFLEQPIERAARRPDLQAEHHTVGREDLRPRATARADRARRSAGNGRRAHRSASGRAGRRRRRSS